MNKFPYSDIDEEIFQQIELEILKICGVPFSLYLFSKKTLSKTLFEQNIQEIIGFIINKNEFIAYEVFINFYLKIKFKIPESIKKQIIFSLDRQIEILKLRGKDKTRLAYIIYLKDIMLKTID